MNLINLSIFLLMTTDIEREEVGHARSTLAVVPGLHYISFMNTSLGDYVYIDVKQIDVKQLIKGNGFDKNLLWMAIQ